MLAGSLEGVLSAELQQTELSIRLGLQEVAVAQFSQRLAAQSPLESRGKDESLQLNITKWVEGIQKNELPVGESIPAAGVSGRMIELPADQARDYDAARALLRCARVGIPTQQCN